VITEELIERGLGAAAEEYDVPPGAVDRLAAQLAPPQRGPRSWTHLSRRTWLAAAAAAIVAAVAVPLALGGGGSGTNSHGLTAAPLPPEKSATSGFAPATTGSGTAATAGGAGGSAGTVNSGAVPLASVPQYRAAKLVPAPSTNRVIKTGELDLQVPRGRVGVTLDRLSGLAGTEGGYVASSHSTQGDGAPYGSVTLRVPVARFERTVAVARTYGSKVLSLETTGTDVTAKYVDLNARISALQATRKTYLAILGRATTIGETLEVEQQITDVQTQIEQLQGQRNVLANHSAMSTLTVTVDQRLLTPVRHTGHRNGFVRAVDRSVSRFVRGVEAIVGALGPIVLVLLLVGLTALVARFGYRRLRRGLV
jgi:hypothetical protein